MHSCVCMSYILVLIIITCHLGKQYYQVITHLVIVPLSLHLVSNYLSFHWFFFFPEIVLNYICILKKVKFGKELNKK